MAVTTPRGAVLRDAEGMRLEFVRTFDEPVDEVWSALTDSPRVARWFGAWSGDPRTGTVELVLAEDEDARPEAVVILRCDPPTRLVVDLPSPDGTWRLTVSLSAESAGTRLVLAHRLEEPYDAGSIGPGWHYYLDRLGAVVSGGVVPEDWDDYYPSLAEAYRLPD